MIGKIVIENPINAGDLCGISLDIFRILDSNILTEVSSSKAEIGLREKMLKELQRVSAHTVVC